jgi:hypothetical protein
LLSLVVTYYGKKRELRWWIEHAKSCDSMPDAESEAAKEAPAEAKRDDGVVAS